jgi:alkanesulfonate monooxygenase SsuD/methylene tetrahydromethanopterin reductase-like flavin-dependent oxidoreductase (luciferase family)
MVHLGLQLPSFTFPGVPGDRLFERVAEIARSAEASGFDSFWVMDHYHQIGQIGPPTDPMFEAYTLLSAVAARTSRIQLGAMVTGVTYRNPAFLAKVVTTLDVVSSGRAILGIGAAWNEQESRAYGYPWPSATERFERLEDALRICRSMFTRCITWMVRSTCRNRCVRAGRRSSSAVVASARPCGSRRGTPTCGTASATSR